LASARAVFETTFTVSTGKPCGVPRPMVNRISPALALALALALAASVVEETASVLGASSEVPGGEVCERNAQAVVRKAVDGAEAGGIGGPSGAHDTGCQDAGAEQAAA
jgi:hypothetical protein